MLRARSAERFPEFALARRAVAKRHIRDLVVREPRTAIGDAGNTAVDDSGFRRADRLQYLRAGRARLRHDVERFVAPVRRHLPAAGIRIVLRADGGEKHLERSHSELKAEGAIAVVGIEPVVAWFEHEAGRHEHCLVAGAANLEKDLALVLELNLLVVKLARHQHAAMHGEDVLAAQSGEFLHAGRRGAADPAVDDGRFH